MRPTGLVVLTALLILSFVFGSCSDDGSSPEVTPTATAIAWDLQVLTQECRSAETGEAQVRGTVRNITAETLEDLVVIASFLDDANTVQAEVRTPLASPEFAPEAVSAFDLRTPNSPAITRCIVRFADHQDNVLNTNYQLVGQGPAETPGPGTPGAETQVAEGE